MCPLRYGLIHTFFHAGGMTSSLILVNVASSVTGVPSGLTYEKPLPRRTRAIPGPLTTLRRNVTAPEFPGEKCFNLVFSDHARVHPRRDHTTARRQADPGARPGDEPQAQPSAVQQCAHGQPPLRRVASARRGV